MAAHHNNKRELAEVEGYCKGALERMAQIQYVPANSSVFVVKLALKPW